MQLELPLIVELPPENPLGRIEYMIGCVKETNHRCIRRLWAENRYLKQFCSELKDRVDFLEKHICSKNAV